MFTLAFSPCPNDTFIFDALVNKKIDTHGFEFNIVLEDVQTLNQWAIEEKYDFTKISYGALPLITNNYKILNSGGALGKGVGPLLVTKNKEILLLQNIEEAISQVVIPGENTTAHLLFSLAYPNFKNKKFLVFNQIEDYVLNNENVAGVIIHENRFTYQQKGLFKIKDLGNFWEQTTQLPIPLGAIAAHKRIDASMAKKVDELIKQSIDYAFKHYPIITNYVKQHAQEMEETVIKQHIDLYVNNYSIDVGVNGKAAVAKLLEVFKNLNKKIEIDFNNIFL